MRRWPIRLAVLGLLAAGLLSVPGSASASAPDLPDLPVPGVPDCKTAPVPEMPGRGIAGVFSGAPKELPAAGDPFAPGSTTTILEQYGYAGFNWSTYDLGCGGTVRDPGAATGTAIGNWMLGATAGLAAFTGALAGIANDPTDLLSVFDPLVKQATRAMRDALFSPFSPLFIALFGVWILMQARKGNLTSTATQVALSLTVLVAVALIVGYPLLAGQAADRASTAATGAVNTAMLGKEGPRAADALTHETILYRQWLAGELGDPDSATARRFGGDLFDSQAVTWRDYDTCKEDQAACKSIIEAKQRKFTETAAQVKEADPDAYQYLTGQNADARVFAGVMAGAGGLAAFPFRIVAALLVIAALIIVRVAVIFAPVIGTLAVWPRFFPMLHSLADTAAAALINSAVFTVGAAVFVRMTGIILAPSSGLPVWASLIILFLAAVVMWLILKPFRRLTRMVRPSEFHPVEDSIDKAKAAAWMTAKHAVVAMVAGRVAGAKLAAEVRDYANEEWPEIPPQPRRARAEDYTAPDLIPEPRHAADAIDPPTAHAPPSRPLPDGRGIDPPPPDVFMPDDDSPAVRVVEPDEEDVYQLLYDPDADAAGAARSAATPRAEGWTDADQEYWERQHAADEDRPGT